MAARQARQALICIGRGIGDVIQTTPLIQAIYSLGYDIDVWLVPDYPETIRLLAGWPAVRGIITSSSEIGLENYDEVIATLLFPYAHFFYRRPVRVVRYDRQDKRHRTECDMVHARALGYRGPTPPTYARTSGRRFSLPPRTVALHPGSSPQPWNRRKRWPYFPALAALLLDRGFGVALVGTEHDGPPSRAWPDEVMDFRGGLDLLDTGALLGHCDAAVSNDSGIAHYAAAVGVPTLVIFGPTSERLYAPPVPNAWPISADLHCRPCGNLPSCHDRRCLTELRPEAVMRELDARLMGDGPSGLASLRVCAKASGSGEGSGTGLAASTVQAIARGRR